MVLLGANIVVPDGLEQPPPSIMLLRLTHYYFVHFFVY